MLDASSSTLPCGKCSPRCSRCFLSGSILWMHNPLFGINGNSFPCCFTKTPNNHLLNSWFGVYGLGFGDSFRHAQRHILADVANPSRRLHQAPIATIINFLTPEAPEGSSHRTPSKISDRFMGLSGHEHIISRLC